MRSAIECEGCGTTHDVETVVAVVGGRDRELHLCPTCKAERLERRRVRSTSKQPPKRPERGRNRSAAKRRPRSPADARPGLRRTVVAGIVVLLLLLLAGYAVLRRVRDSPGKECYPGAGFECETPIEE